MKTILVVEDEADIRDNLSWLLEAGGYRVLAAGGGREGAERAVAEHPDLIVCDVMMPEVDGYEVLRRVRAHAETALTPFLFLTARAGREDQRRGMTAGADDYLTKPFAAREVLDAVAARLDKQASVEQRQEARLDELRSGISQALPHELRTPLAAVLGFSQLLLDDWDDLAPGAPEETREMVGFIHEAGRRLERTVENYGYFAELELAAADPDAAPVRAAPLDAAAILGRTARDVAARHERTGDLDVAFHGRHVAVREAHLAKAAAELIDNAFKFSEAGTPVEICFRDEPDGGRVLEVADRGRGLRPDEARRAGAFLQFDREREEDTGSGLGVAIVRRLGRLYGATLHLEPREGGGTTARLSALPAPYDTENSSARKSANAK